MRRSSLTALVIAGTLIVPAFSHAETWSGFGSGTITAGNPYASFSACWEVVNDFDDFGCNRNQQEVTFADSVTHRVDSYPNGACNPILKTNYGCTYTRTGGNCPTAGSSVFPPDEGFDEPSGNWDEGDDGEKFCSPQPTGTACEYEVECEGGECSAEYSGKACNDTPKTAVPCAETEGLTTECAAACGQYGYDSEGCPENACADDITSLDCLNQCSFHPWEQCALIPGGDPAPTDPDPDVPPFTPPDTGTSSSGGGPGGAGGTGSDGGGPGDPTDPTFDHEDPDFVGVDFAELIDFMKNFFRGPDMPDPIDPEYYPDQLDPLSQQQNEAVQDVLDRTIPEYDTGFLDSIIPDNSSCDAYSIDIPAFDTLHTSATDWVVMSEEMCDVMDTVVKPILAWLMYALTAVSLFFIIFDARGND